MRRLLFLASMTPLMLLAGNAYARVTVPEIDGSGAAMAIGLAVGLAALIRERRK